MARVGWWRGRGVSRPYRRGRVCGVGGRTTVRPYKIPFYVFNKRLNLVHMGREMGHPLPIYVTVNTPSAN